MSKTNKRKISQIDPEPPTTNSNDPPAIVLEEVLDPVIEKCPECQSVNIATDYTEGQMVCTDCGLTLGERIIAEGSDWRTFSDAPASNGANPNRVGGPENDLMADFGLSTGIGGSGDDGLSRIQNKTTSKQKRLMDGFHKTQTLATRMSLPKSVVEYSNALFKHVEDSGGLHGRKLEAVLSACLYFACRHEKVPRTFKELIEVSDVDQRTVQRCFSKMKKLKLYKLPKDKYGANPRMEEKNTAPTSSAFMDRYINALKLPFKLGAVAEVIANNATEKLKSLGKTCQPTTMAGTAIYIVSLLSEEKNRRTLTDIGTVVKMSEATLRGTYKILHPYRVAIIPVDYASTEAIQSMQP